MGVRPVPPKRKRSYPFVVKKTAKPKMGVRRPTQVRCEAHLKWIRTLKCLNSVTDAWHCHGDVQAAHVRTRTDGGTGMKPSDFWTVPLCAAHHREQHQIGEAAFQDRHGIDMRETAAQLAKRSPYQDRWGHD